MSSIIIGKLVRSNAHTDYVCQVYGPGEVETPPAPADYAFGCFVRIPLPEGAGHLVGIVYDTVLLNPDFGSLGPRLSPAPDLAVFSPDYLAEKATLVGITAIGTVAPNGDVSHDVPALAAQIDTLVEGMDEGSVRRFHRPGPENAPVRLGYVPLLLGLGTPLAHHLLLHVVGRLKALFPEQATRLGVLQSELAWQAVIGPLGGAR